MSGSYTVDMDGYYTRGNKKTAYTVTDASAYRASYKYYYCLNGAITGPVSRLPATYDDYVYVLVADASDSTDYVVVNKEISYYPVTAASDITLNLTGTQALSNQIFEASDTDEDIDFNVTGVTFTKST